MSFKHSKKNVSVSNTWNQTGLKMVRTVRVPFNTAGGPAPNLIVLLLAVKRSKVAVKSSVKKARV